MQSNRRGSTGGALALVTLVVTAALISQGATLASRAQEPAPAVQAPPSATVQGGGDLAGRFVTHAEHIQPGMVAPPAGLALRNPHEGDPNAVATGAKLFVVD